MFSKGGTNCPHVELIYLKLKESGWVAIFWEIILKKNLRRMMQFNDVFPDYKKVSSLWRQLSWTHFKTLIYIKDDLRQDFYTHMCRVEKWSVRVLRKKVDSMMFERNAISRASISKLIDIDKIVFMLINDLFAVFYKAVMIVLDNQPFND